MRQGADARPTENRVLIAWKQTATALLKSEETDDRTLGREELRSVAEMGHQGLGDRLPSAPAALA